MKQVILVAEDDVFLLNAYKVKLSKAGYDVLTASDGNEAISLIEEKIPDLILMDLVMPKKDGFDTLTEIKKEPKWKNIPVLITSNLGQKEDLDRAMALGASDYLVKSNVSLSEILDRISDCLK